MNNKKSVLFLKLFFLLLCFIILYRNVNSDIGRYILILMVLPMAMLFEHVNLSFFMIISFISILISIFTFGIMTYETMIIAAVFIISIPMLSVFSTKKSKLKINDGLKRKNDELKLYKGELLNERNSLIAERENLEKKLERIIHFYIISKELNKSIYIPRSVANTVLNILSSRQGVEYCFITRSFKNKQGVNRVQMFSRLNEETKKKWYKMINDNKEIKNLKKPTMINMLDNIENKSVVVWPVVAGLNWDFRIFLVVKPEYSQLYIEEGEIFIPHLKLSAKRISLVYELEEKSRIDGLTGLYLKRYFLEKLKSEYERVKRYKTNFYLMMFDIDYFKKINDTYGHLTGDKVLKEITHIISTSVRPGDIVGRYGGEEFIVLLPSISKEAVLDIAENIRKSVEKTVFKENTIEFGTTISGGICEYMQKTKPTKLIDNVDKALYESKKNGRNRITVYSNL